jgi:branched-chain amino acid transport system ATP-binding protein
VTMLDISGLSAGYDGSQVLFEVDLSIARGEVVTLLGRNGMGKSTLINTIAGILRPSAGQIRFDGAVIKGLPSYRVARHGIGLVPEGRQVFPNLTVRENLCATAADRFGQTKPWTIEAVLELFPGLSPRLESPGRLLSGGEQQMVAIGRALLTNPKLLILDEATEGLAPLVREEIWRCIERVKAMGQAILITDKNVKALSRIADRHYFLEKGRIALCCGSGALLDNPELRQRYLGV